MTNILIVISSTYDLFMLTAILKEDLKDVNTKVIVEFEDKNTKNKNIH